MFNKIEYIKVIRKVEAKLLLKCAWVNKKILSPDAAAKKNRISIPSMNYY